MLTEEQRARIHTDIVAPSPSSRPIITTGTVAFNGDRSTPVLSQISGPVARILVNTGTHVRARDAAGARLVAGFRRRRSRRIRRRRPRCSNAARIATLDEQLFKNDAIARSDLDQARSDSASACADREAAIQQMVALGVDSATIDAIRQGQPGAARRPA